MPLNHTPGAEQQHETTLALMVHFDFLWIVHNPYIRWLVAIPEVWQEGENKRQNKKQKLNKTKIGFSCSWVPEKGRLHLGYSPRHLGTLAEGLWVLLRGSENNRRCISLLIKYQEVWREEGSFGGFLGNSGDLEMGAECRKATEVRGPDQGSGLGFPKAERAA